MSSVARELGAEQDLAAFTGQPSRRAFATELEPGSGCRQPRRAVHSASARPSSVAGSSP